MENHFPQATSLFCDKIDTSNTEEQQAILNVLTENIDIEPDAEVYDDDNFQDFPVKTKKDDDLTEKNNKVVRIDLKVKKKPATKRKSEQKFEELASSVVGSGFKKSKPGFHEILFYEKLQKYMEGEIALPPKLEPKPWLNEDGSVKKTRIQKYGQKFGKIMCKLGRNIFKNIQNLPCLSEITGLKKWPILKHFTIF